MAKKRSKKPGAPEESSSPAEDNQKQEAASAPAESLTDSKRIERSRWLERRLDELDNLIEEQMGVLKNLKAEHASLVLDLRNLWRTDVDPNQLELEIDAAPPEDGGDAGSEDELGARSSERYHAHPS